jgi:predicted acylesterase/phospholipase RssA
LAAGLVLSGCQHGDIVIDAGASVATAGIYASTATPVQNAAPDGRAGGNILVLTSGGADGAFGAGVLAAWSESGRRPVFDIVAGTSTGALQATPAFLGPAFDGLLERVYTTIRTRDILRSNGLKTLLGTGYYDPAPLRRLLQELITDEMLDAVAVAHKTGRRLYVVTTDMTAGKAVFWDMGAIAASGDNRKSHYVDVLVASVAVPGLIEPVRVRDRRSGDVAVHSDGGVKTPVPLEPFMLDARKGRRDHVWIIANGHVSRDAALRSDATSTIGLARRGVSQLLRQLLYASVREAEVRSLRAGAKFHLVALPDTVPEAANPFDFRPQEMRSLYQAGRGIGLRRFPAVQVAAR